MVTLPNIYHYKNLQYLPLIPIGLMIIAIFLSSGLVLDSSLSGGVSVILQANTSLTPQQIATVVSTKLHTTAPSVITSRSTVQISIAANKSLSDAENYLLYIYSDKASYSTAIVNETNYQIALQHDPNNQTIINLLSQSKAAANKSLTSMATNLQNELTSLKPFIGTKQFNASNPDQMVTIGQNAYANASTVYKNNILNVLKGIIPYTSYSYQEVTVLQSQFFLGQLRMIIIVAFILISIIVFFIFRSIAPSIAVIFGAGNDMIIALGAMALFKIPLGIASIGGLLMLLGYSIDTDVLTAVRILKRHEGTPEERAYGSMKTGLTMTITAICSFAVLFAVSLIAYVPTYYEISGVVLFGLIGDLMTTWLGNAVFILLWLKRKKG